MFKIFALTGLVAVLGAAPAAMASAGNLGAGSTTITGDGVVTVLEQAASQSRKRTGGSGTTTLPQPSSDLPPSA